MGPRERPDLGHVGRRHVHRAGGRWAVRPVRPVALGVPQPRRARRADRRGGAVRPAGQPVLGQARALPGRLAAARGVGRAAGQRGERGRWRRTQRGRRARRAAARRPVRPPRAAERGPGPALGGTPSGLPAALDLPAARVAGHGLDHGDLRAAVRPAAGRPGAAGGRVPGCRAGRRVDPRRAAQRRREPTGDGTAHPAGRAGGAGRRSGPGRRRAGRAGHRDRPRALGAGPVRRRRRHRDGLAAPRHPGDGQRHRPRRGRQGVSRDQHRAAAGQRRRRGADRGRGQPGRAGPGPLGALPVRRVRGARPRRPGGGAGRHPTPRERIPRAPSSSRAGATPGSSPPGPARPAPGTWCPALGWSPPGR